MYSDHLGALNHIRYGNEANDSLTRDLEQQNQQSLEPSIILDEQSL